MQTKLEHIKWTLDTRRNCTIQEQKQLLAVAEAAAKAWPLMVGLFEFAALHGMTEPDPDIVALRAAIAPLMEAE